MPKLTDTQLVILSGAARRQDGAVLPLPKSLKIKGGAVTKTLDGLRKKGLLNEKPAARNATAWREGEDGRRMLLVITDAGLQALDSEPAEESSKQPTPTKTRAKKPRRRIVQKPITATPKGKKVADGSPPGHQAGPADRSAQAQEGYHHRGDRRNAGLAAPYGPGGPHPAASTGLPDRAGPGGRGQPLSHR
jgi:DNA-binding MarR family transcriptional regulator